mmetsp:Transcript_75451/g.245421  ORF Transcript_75451/g.245421 Transcript_75451/m.245421 type:complete len:247 (+) Transcript_75451:1282-2022(+)
MLAVNALVARRPPAPLPRPRAPRLPRRGDADVDVGPRQWWRRRRGPVVELERGAGAAVVPGAPSSGRGVDVDGLVAHAEGAALPQLRIQWPRRGPRGARRAVAPGFRVLVLLFGLLAGPPAAQRGQRRQPSSDAAAHGVQSPGARARAAVWVQGAALHREGSQNRLRWRRRFARQGEVSELVVVVAESVSEQDATGAPQHSGWQERHRLCCLAGPTPGQARAAFIGGRPHRRYLRDRAAEELLAMS